MVSLNLFDDFYLSFKNVHILLCATTSEWSVELFMFILDSNL